MTNDLKSKTLNVLNRELRAGRSNRSEAHSTDVGLSFELCGAVGRTLQPLSIAGFVALNLGDEPGGLLRVCASRLSTLHSQHCKHRDPKTESVETVDPAV